MSIYVPLKFCPAKFSMGDSIITHFMIYDKISMASVIRFIILQDVYKRQIDTYDISIEPYEDCCTVFTPKHPRTRPVLKYVKEAQEKPNFGPCLLYTSRCV